MAKVRMRREQEEAVLRLRLSDPPGNIVDREMLQGLVAALEEVPRLPRLRLVVLEGEGNHFSFGASIHEHRREVVGDLLRRFHAVVLRLAELPVPCAALVRGQCLGGGFELALACHWIFAEEGAVFGLPEVGLGVFAPAASVLLPRRAGSALAEHLLLSGSRLPAAALLAAGLVREIAPPGGGGALLSRIVEEEVLPRSAATLRLAVRAARMTFLRGLAEDLAAVERLYLEELLRTRDADEGIEAFLEKRPPRFEHR